MLIAAAMSAARASRSAPRQRQAEQRRRCLRAVDQRQPFLRRERDRREPARAQRRARRTAARVVTDQRLAFADQHEREMRERRQVAARAHRPARRHDADGRRG